MLGQQQQQPMMYVNPYDSIQQPVYGQTMVQADPQQQLVQAVEVPQEALYGQNGLIPAGYTVQEVIPAEAPGGPIIYQQQPQQQIMMAAPGAPLEQPMYGQQIIQEVPQQMQIIQQPQQQQVQVIQQPQQQQVQVVQSPQGGGTNIKHVPLAKCRVLYLGCAVPLATAVGLEAIQGPLKERYNPGQSEMQGIDAWLTVYSSGMQLRFVEDDIAVHWFPISSLHVCAAVKAISLVMSDGSKQSKFVALDSEHGSKSAHPPIFASIMRRTKGRKVLECHAFICKSNKAAMALVQSCTHAYEHKEGWCDEPAPVEIESGRHEKHDPMRLLAAVPQKRDAPNEYYETTPKHGYFYTPNQGLVKNYAVNGNKKTPQPQMPVAQQPQMQTMLEPVLVPIGPDGQQAGEVIPVGGQQAGGLIDPAMMGGQMGGMMPMDPAMMGGQMGGMMPMDPAMMGGQMGGMMPMDPAMMAGYFADWNAFPGHPVAIMGGEYAPPKHRKKKKKRRTAECCTDDTCCCATDDCCNDVTNKQEYYVDNYYKDYREDRAKRRKERDERKRRKEYERGREDEREERRRDDRRDDRRPCNHEPSRDVVARCGDRRDDRRDYVVRREPDYPCRRDPYYDDPYIRDHYNPPMAYDPIRAPVMEDDFYFYGPGYAYGGEGYEGYGYDYGGYGYDQGGYGYDQGGYGYDQGGYDQYYGGGGGGYGDQYYGGMTAQMGRMGIGY